MLKKIRFFFVLLLCLVTTHSFAQSVEGNWSGTLEVSGMELPLVLHIQKSADTLTGTMASPAQTQALFPFSEIRLQNRHLAFKINNLKISYTGEWDGDTTISGQFTQGALSFPLVFHKGEAAVPVAKNYPRPQTPQPPFPYTATEVRFPNKAAGIELAGTLTLPPYADSVHKVPVAVLITGSGPQNRDAEMVGHKPFWVIADRLSRNGYAVLRYDDRGVAQSGGKFVGSTTADFATDVYAAVQFLQSRPEINTSKIGLIGHSEGGTIAPIVAAAHPADINYIILLAGTGIRGDSILLLQQALIARKSGVSDTLVAQNREMFRQVFSILNREKDTARAFSLVEKYMVEKYNGLPAAEKEQLGQTADQFAVSMVQQVMANNPPWMLYFLRFDPATALKKVRCRVLALNGSNDLQVPPTENLTAIAAALKAGHNKRFLVRELPGLNHLFQHSDTGLPYDYQRIEETFSPEALSVMLDWLNTYIK